MTSRHASNAGRSAASPPLALLVATATARRRRPFGAGARRSRRGAAPDGAGGRYRRGHRDRPAASRRRSTSSASASSRTSSPISWAPKRSARVGDSTVSLALRRVPGLTLVNDQFIYVRGLGERYSSVLLNGAQVPSPDLTRNVIPLDIFPTEIIDALAVQKGYSPGGTRGVRRRQRRHYDARHPERPRLQRRDRLGHELRQRRRRA